MCGIFLYINKTGVITPSTQNKVRGVCEEFINTRGPDFSENIVGVNYISHQSVLSLTTNKKSAANYRMNNRSTLFVGEIFKFKHEDELDYVYESSPNKFDQNDYDGFYASIWLDINQHKLDSIHLKTDPQGEKRLFYINNSKHLIISSVPGALVPFLTDRRISLPFFLRYLGGRHAISYDDSMFDEIRQIKGGCLYNASKHKEYEFNLGTKYSFSKWFEKDLPESQDKLKDLLDVRIKSTIADFTDHSEKKDSAAVISGGVDSSLQSYYLSESNLPKLKYFTIKFLNKDCASSEISKFKDRIGLNSLNHFSYVMSPDDYFYYAKECLKVTAGVIPTHSMPSSMFLADKMKQEGIRTFYSGEGADECFLGYQTYDDQYNLRNNHSVYSKVIDEFKEISGFNKAKDNALEVCSTNLSDRFSQKELGIKASSFMDFFAQCRSVGFFSSDIGMSHYGLEGRTIFARRDIVKLALGAPPSILLKPSPKTLLKELYTEKLHNKPAKKVGFAGFPNEISSKVSLPDLNHLESKYFQKVKPFYNIRDYEWKVINYKFFKFYFDTELY